MWEFEVGAKVVRINDPPKGQVQAPGEVGTVLGAVYTVRKIERWHDNGDLLLWLDEIVNPPVLTTRGRVERGFRAEYFRPLDSYGDLHSLFQPLQQPEEVGA